MRNWWSPFYKQGYDRRVTFLGRDGVKVTDFTLDAWRALESAVTFHWYGKAEIVSTYYPRPIASSGKPSLHGFSGVALDIDPAKNPFRRGTRWRFDLCKFTKAQVEAVLAIRTVSGAQVWRWGGDFGDYMHWQLNCKPSDIKSGIDWSTVAGAGKSVDVQEEYMLKRGDAGVTVRIVQKLLLAWDSDALPAWGADSDFGAETETWVKEFQAAHDLPETGQVDGLTMAVLGTYREAGQVAVGGIDDLEVRVTEVEVGVDALGDRFGGLIETLRSV